MLETPAGCDDGAYGAEPMPGLTSLRTAIGDAAMDVRGPVNRLDAAGVTTPAEVAFFGAELRDLRLEVDHLRSERERLIETQRHIMDLLESRSADRLLHDLRNLLNERNLLRAITDSMP